MSYHEGELLIAAQVGQVTGFDVGNVVIGKWNVLNQGLAPNYAILKRGGFSRTQAAMSTNENLFQTVIQVWRRYKDDGTTYELLIQDVDAIIARMDQYRKAGDTGGTIVDVFINAGREVEEMWNKSGGLSWLKQDLIVTWKEHEVITYAE